MTRKCAVTPAEQTFTPQNVLRAQLYWSTPWPTGIVEANHKNDSDEFGLWVEKQELQAVGSYRPGCTRYCTDPCIASYLQQPNRQVLSWLAREPSP